MKRYVSFLIVLLVLCTCTTPKTTKQLVQEGTPKVFYFQVPVTAFASFARDTFVVDRKNEYLTCPYIDFYNTLSINSNLKASYRKEDADIVPIIIFNNSISQKLLEPKYSNRLRDILASAYVVIYDYYGKKPVVVAPKSTGDVLLQYKDIVNLALIEKTDPGSNTFRIDTLDLFRYLDKKDLLVNQ